MKSIKMETLMEYQFVSSPYFSPDGRKIAFVVQRASMQKNGYQGNLYLYDLEKKSVSQITSSGDVKQFVWLDADTLVFPSERGKQESENKDVEGTTLYQLSLSGGEAVEAAYVPWHVVSMKVAGAGRVLLQCVYESEERKAGRNSAYEVFDEVPFWFNGKGIINGKRTRLYLCDLNLQEPKVAELRPVSLETEECGMYSVRGNHILYKAYPWNEVLGQYDGIYLYHMETEERRCILEKDVIYNGLAELWSDSEAVISATESSAFGNEKYKDFYTLNLETGERRLLKEYDYGSGASSVGSDARLGGGQTVKSVDGALYFVTTRGDSAYLSCLQKDGTLTDVVDTSGSCDSFDVKNGHIVVCGMYGDQLAELYLDGEQITYFNDMSQWSISTPRAYTMKARDGFSLTGWLMYPVGYEKGRKYPAIFNIHGGPRTVFGTVFHHEMQVWANEGYFVFYTNPRGSDGGGTEFGSLNGKYGTIDYDNLMDFTDYILGQEPDIDQRRVGVTGGSYGGFMTNWIIGHTDRFKAAVSQRSIANWISFEYMSDIGHTFTKDTQSVFAVEDPHKLWNHSPMKYIQGCKTPTLFVHSEQDYRCNMAEGISMFAALKILGVESRMCVLKGENHELSRSGKPRNRMVRMRELLMWMDSHLKQDGEMSLAGRTDDLMRDQRIKENKRHEQ